MMGLLNVFTVGTDGGRGPWVILPIAKAANRKQTPRTRRRGRKKKWHCVGVGSTLQARYKRGARR